MLYTYEISRRNAKKGLQIDNPVTFKKIIPLKFESLIFCLILIIYHCSARLVQQSTRWKLKLQLLFYCFLAFKLSTHPLLLVQFQLIHTKTVMLMKKKKTEKISISSIRKYTAWADFQYET